MAIKVSNTQVIGDSRELTNIASVDSTTAASITSGGVGASASSIVAANSAPSNPSVGDCYFDNTDDTLYIYDGSAWGGADFYT